MWLRFNGFKVQVQTTVYVSMSPGVNSDNTLQHAKRQGSGLSKKLSHKSWA